MPVSYVRDMSSTECKVSSYIHGYIGTCLQVDKILVTLTLFPLASASVFLYRTGGFSSHLHDISLGFSGGGYLFSFKTVLVTVVFCIYICVL